METLPTKDTPLYWKNKYVATQKKNKCLQQKVRRHQKQIAKLRQRVKLLKQEKHKGLACPLNHPLLSVKPKGYRFHLLTICLCLIYQVRLGLSYRQTASAIAELYVLLGITQASPSWSVIRQWVLKQGYYQLTQPHQQESQAYIIDESASIGKEKALVILGVSLPAAPRHQALSFADTQVLSVASQTSWKSTAIAQQIDAVTQTNSHQVAYIISDKGNAIVKAIKDTQHIHVLDCTHWMANCIERYYKGNPDFQDQFQPDLGKIRQKLTNGKNVGMIAPNMRTKARFLNLYSITEWLEKVLAHWTHFNEEQKTLLAFVKNNEALTLELIAIIKLVKQLSKLLKNEGITDTTQAAIQQVFEQNNYKCATITQFQLDMQQYVETIKKSLPQHKHILCCSDIIESYFGKFKYRGNKAAAQGITKDLLVICIFKNKFTLKEVLKGMENTRWKKVIDWVEENITQSFAETKQVFWENLASKNTS